MLYQRITNHIVKKKTGHNSHRKIKPKNTRPGMAEITLGTKPVKIFQVRNHAACYQSGKGNIFFWQITKRKNSSRVRKSKRHLQENNCQQVYNFFSPNYASSNICYNF